MKRKLISLIAVVLVVCSLTSCSSFIAGFKEGFEDGMKEVAKGDYKRGVWDGNSYTNESLGIKLELPTDWTITPDEEIMSIMDSGYALLEEEEKKNYDFLKLKIINDFMVFGPDYASNIQLVLENLSLSTNGTSMDEQAYLDTVTKQVMSLEEVKYTVGETYKAKIAGQEYLVLPLIANEMLAQKYYCRKAGNFIVSFVATVPLEEEESIDVFMDSIKAL